jgi:hypoxanthine phosphoribosyltransferase
MKKKVFVNWEEFDQMIDEITSQINKDYTKIFTIPRGGLPVATCIAHRLKINTITLDKSLIDDNTLIVEDIIGSGETMLPYKDYDIACLGYVPGALVKPKYYARVFKNDVYYVFPWERKDSEMKRDRDIKP